MVWYISSLDVMLQSSDELACPAVCGEPLLRDKIVHDDDVNGFRSKQQQQRAIAHYSNRTQTTQYWCEALTNSIVQGSLEATGEMEQGHREQERSTGKTSVLAC